MRNVNVTPVAGKPIPDSELESYLKEATSAKYYLNALSLTDRIIFILYLWITDMCFSAQYLTEKKNMLLPSCNTYIDIPHSYEDNIWEKRASSASLYNYFFINPHTNIWLLICWFYRLYENNPFRRFHLYACNHYFYHKYHESKRKKGEGPIP